MQYATAVCHPHCMHVIMGAMFKNTLLQTGFLNALKVAGCIPSSILNV